MSSVLHSSIYEIEWCRIFSSADKKEWLDGSIANVAQLRTVKIRNFSNHKKKRKKMMMLITFSKSRDSWIEEFFFRSSRLQLVFKTSALKIFVIFTGNRLYWSYFLIKLLVWRPASLLKRDSSTDSCEIYFLRTPILKHMCERPST